MPLYKALEKLCNIIMEQNIDINSAIRRKVVNWDMVVAATKETISKIRKLRNKFKNEPEAKSIPARPKISVNEPSLPKKSRRETEQENEYKKLLQGVATIKDVKLQQQMEDENDELISGVKKVKLVLSIRNRFYQFMHLLMNQFYQSMHLLMGMK